MITVDFLKKLSDYGAAQARVIQTLQGLKSDEDLVRFMNHYSSWNMRFAPGVAQLVANIGDQPELFLEPKQPRALADRSCMIASYIFDAARDEFNDHITRHRDPHRSLAQATLAALAQHTETKHVLDEPIPAWLKTLCTSVVWSYGGANADAPFNRIFSGIGFHLGSELLADAEFSLIDEHLRLTRNDLVQKVMRTKVNIANVDHRGYAWIGVHSGHDGAAEADHFAWALEGTNLALDLLPSYTREHAETQLSLGYMRFASMHNMFFTMAAEGDRA